MKVDNAIILAAGTSSRFVPLSYEKHKALTVVKDEVLIERQIEQIIQAGINEIFIVVGYKAEQFEYLKRKYGVKLIYNSEYSTRNNNGSIWYIKDILRNSYICSSDNYFVINPFEQDVECAYYAAEFANGHTDEWCMEEDDNGYIKSVTIGGYDKWYMLGHTFWDERFSNGFIKFLEKEYNLEETKNKLWESIFIDHLDILKMKIRKYNPGVILEFDSLDDLREFDNSYIENSRSNILKEIANKIGVTEKNISKIKPLKRHDNSADGFEFICNGKKYEYSFDNKQILGVIE